jgi:hypothetical protein
MIDLKLSLQVFSGISIRHGFWHPDFLPFPAFSTTCPLNNRNVTVSLLQALTVSLLQAHLNCR